ncbi:hypothetical protein BGX31_008191 [Mortierella sp. GBA43]|nr:hypothetical protein BGX31_008191 [Mortierella sp. GBA43]
MAPKILTWHLHTACKKYFAFEKYYEPGVAINVRGKFDKRGTIPTLPITRDTPISPALPAFHVVVPQDAPSFKFTALFEDYQAGHYVVSWRVKLLDNFSVPNGLRFFFSVAYDAEKDTKTTMEVVVPPEELARLDRNRWYDLELETFVSVQPFLRSNGYSPYTADIDVVMSNCESMDCTYSGLLVDFIELRPLSEDHECLESSDAMKHIVKKASTPKFTIDAMKSPVFKNDKNPEIPSNLPIKRLAWSKESRYLATLALWKDSAYVSVWDMKHIDDPSNPNMDMTAFHWHCAVAVVKHPRKWHFTSLSMGLAISPKGDQVAIYQEPMIGQWTDGSKVRDSEFPFCLLERQEHVAVDMTQQCNDGSTSMDANQRRSGITSFDAEEGLTKVHGYHPHRLIRSDDPHRILKNFIGYGTFLTETDNKFWEMGDVKTALSANVNAEDHQHDDGADDNTQSTSNEGKSASRTLFVACNGIQIDIFRVRQRKGWENTHSINMAGLVPTLSRRVTCKIMMDLVTSNTFIWLEDGGLCCTVWDLQKGSHVSYVSNSDKARLGTSIFRGNHKIAIAPDETIIAMGGADGILTTYYTSTGIEISRKEFPGHQIEYFAFHGHKNQLFVTLRNSTTLKLRSCIVDPLCLDAEVTANQIPIPIIGKTILAFFRDTHFKDKGVVFEADGSRINCYISHEPVHGKVNKSDTALVDANDPNGVFYPPRTNVQEGKDQDKLKEEPHKEAQDEDMATPVEETLYELKTCIERELAKDGDGSMYWVHRVDVVKNPDHQDKNVVFSFVPEPWMRVSAAEIRQAQKLLRVYFLPGSKRFVVQGMQTLQIWSLPTDENNNFHLVFIWSQPRTDDDPKVRSRGRKYKTDLVGKFYHRITGLSIYLDPATGNAVADINLRNGTIQNGVIIPGVNRRNVRIEHLHCIRSIHLLAAAYAYSMPKPGFKVTRKLGSDVFDFERHAIAIAQFARRHINRLISRDDFRVRDVDQVQDSKISDLQPMTAIESPKRAITIRILSPSKKPEVVKGETKNTARILNLNRPKKPSEDDKRRDQVLTILTLLLDQTELSYDNHIFVEGLFLTPGHEWIPHTSVALNPIRRVIGLRNDRLLKIMINYCLKCAKEIHLGYLEPVEQCLSKLLDQHPEIVSDIFIKTSYIPVHNEAYVRSHFDSLNSTSMKFGNAFTRSEGDTDDNDNRLFTLQSRLPTGKQKREIKFPEKDSKKPLEPKSQSERIYVSPFQFQPIPRSMDNPYDIPLDEGHKRSVFSRIAGRGDYFHSPAMVVSLLYKWKKFGYRYWMIRFAFVVIFFCLVLAVTAAQIEVSTTWKGSAPTPEELQARYLPKWRPVFVTTIVMGFVLVLYEIRQLFHSADKYLKSPYNYADLVAYISPIVGCFIFLGQKPHSEEGIVDYGPSSIWIMGYGILFLYLNFLFELRVIRQPGVVVNIIFNITRRIGWFFMIFGIFLVGFTHALLYLLHTRRYRPCAQDKSCGDDYPSEYPNSFWKALLATYFFLAGRYDPINNSLDSGTVGLQIMMVVFFFFTAILLLNILIALMNDAFNASEQEGALAHLKLLSEVVAEVENIIPDSSRRRGDYYPKYIYYCASEEEATQFRAQFSEIKDEESLSFDSKFLLEKSSASVSKIESIQRTVDVIQQVVAHQEVVIDRMGKENAELKDLLRAFLEQSGVHVPLARSTSERVQRSRSESQATTIVPHGSSSQHRQSVGSWMGGGTIPE